MDTSFRYRLLGSPLGALVLSGDLRGLTGVHFTDQANLPHLPPDREDADSFEEAAQRVGDYLEGHDSLSGLSTAPIGSAFQRSVWRELQAIPYGKRATYRQVAEELGSAAMARAVGNAVAANPLLLLIPCHRVVLTGGKIGSYSAGVERKRMLLDLEALSSA